MATIMAGDRLGFRPVHPGVIVKDNIDALGITIEAFAAHIGVSRQTVHAIIAGRSSVTAEMAVRLGRAFNTSSRLWLNLQSNHDVWEPERSASLARMRPCRRGAKRALGGRQGGTLSARSRSKAGSAA
jgi:addiction module HigA family antidote